MLLKSHRFSAVPEVTRRNPTTGAPRPAPPPADAAAREARYEAIFRYHGIPATGRILWLMAALFSVGLHAALFLGFNQHKAVRKMAVVKEESVALLIMPDLHEEEEKKVVELSDDEPAPPSVPVPMLQDVPLSLTESAFTQLIDPTVPMKLEGTGSVLAIPLNIQRGRPDMSAIKDLFNIGDLDRRPEPIVQNPPVFPFELRQAISEARVRVGFIVTAKGDVIMPYIISSTHAGFERSTLDAVVKWKFKPGQKSGRKVNTRVEQPIDFTIVEEK